MFIYIMINNNLQNPYAINEIYASRPLRSESSSLSANNMPINDRIVNETSVTKRPLNNTPPNEPPIVLGEIFFYIRRYHYKPPLHQKSAQTKGGEL